jgi:ribose-phosphate pyrophosphokinase
VIKISKKYLIIGPSSQLLGMRIAKMLNIDTITTETKKFPDGENYLRLNIDDESSIEGNEVIIVHTTGASTKENQNARIMELFMLISSTKRMNPKNLTVVVPYMAYSRQDKIFRPGETKFAYIITKIIDSFGIDNFYTVDIHAPEILNEFSIPAKNLDPMPELAKFLNNLNLTDVVVIAPDKGAVTRSEQFATHLGEDIQVKLFKKERDVRTGEIMMFADVDLTGKDVIITDDIIATGGTMANAIEISKKCGAEKVIAVGTHALLLENAAYRIMNAGADDIIGTDSIDTPVSKVSLAPLIVKELK